MPLDKGPEFDNKLPPIPKMDVAANDELQQEMARAHPVNASNREFHNANALINQIEQHSLKILGHVQREQYAEALSIVGRYKDAAKMTADPQKKTEWKAVVKAIEMDDDKVCKCGDFETVEMVEGVVTKVTRSRTFTVNKVFSHRHKGHVDLTRCSKCGHQNAR